MTYCIAMDDDVVDIAGNFLIPTYYFQKVKDLVVADKQSPKQQRVLAKSLWLLSTSRNALVVVICSLISFVLHNNDPSNVPFKLTGKSISYLTFLSPAKLIFCIIILCIIILIRCCEIWYSFYSAATLFDSTIKSYSWLY